jgi:hypothetical protein
VIARQTAAAAPPGGWARILGVPDSTPLDQALITRILDYLEAEIRKDPSMSPGVFNPFVEQAIRDWRASLENALRKLIGTAVGSLPGDLTGAYAPQGNPLGPGSLLGGAAGELIAGLGDAVGRGVLLAAILGAIILGAWRIVSPAGRTVIVPRLGRSGT